MNEVTVLIPALNEEQALGKVIDRIRALPIPCNILVIDNASTDKTASVVKGKGVKLIFESQKGKANAIRRGLAEVETSFVIMIDADGTYPVEDIPIMAGMLSRYDIVKGHRNWLEKGAMTKTHHFGNWALSWLTTLLYGKRTRDVCSGMWAMRMSKVKQFNLTSNGFTLEADLYINTVKTGCRFVEIPITYKKRIDGDKAKLMFKDGLEIGWFLIKRRLK